MLLLCRSPVTVHRTLVTRRKISLPLQMGVCCVDWPHILISNKQLARTTRLQHFTQFRKKRIFHTIFFLLLLSVYVCVYAGIGEGFRFSGASVRLSFMPPDMNAGY